VRSRILTALASRASGSTSRSGLGFRASSRARRRSGSADHRARRSRAGRAARGRRRRSPAAGSPRRRRGARVGGVNMRIRTSRAQTSATPDEFGRGASASGPARLVLSRRAAPRLAGAGRRPPVVGTAQAPVARRSDERHDRDDFRNREEQKLGAGLAGVASLARGRRVNDSSAWAATAVLGRERPTPQGNRLPDRANRPGSCGSDRLERRGGLPGAPVQGPGEAAWWLWSFSRLWVAAVSLHSQRTADLPRRPNRSIPRLCLIWPNTGSTVAWRFL